MFGTRLVIAGALAAATLSACAGESRVEPSSAATTDSVSPSRPTPTTSSSATPEPQPEPEPEYGVPAPARLTSPELDLDDFPIVPYRGRTDDAPGTAIQNDGRLASPHGPQGGVGPGGVGNYQVTGHRLSSTMPFRYLPELTRGDRVYVESRGVRHVYRIVTTRETSFREPQSLREQRAAVPGRPGVEATRAMLTLSTCATLEDHAEGNFWSDRFDNPEHRIDKIGVLVRSIPIRGR